MGSRVELFEEIRRDARVEGLSIRELADRHRVHRRTVRQALDAALPPPRKTYPARRRPAIDPWTEVIDGWLVADKDVPRKQRHTARRVWQRLVAEHAATCSEVTVSRYVARRRVELGVIDIEVCIPQTHPAGAEAEVDFGEFYAWVGGQWVKCWMFVMRLSHSGRAFHAGFGTQAQEAFLEGHVLAFDHFGGVPGRIRYDNLKPAGIILARSPASRQSIVAALIATSSAASASVRSSSLSRRSSGTSTGSIGARRLPAGARSTAQHLTSAVMMSGPYVGPRGGRCLTTFNFPASRNAALA